MGRKSREKRERRIARERADQNLLISKFREYEGWSAHEAKAAKEFQEQIEAIRKLLCQYKRIDATIALSVSELWPANAGYPSLLTQTLRRLRNLYMRYGQNSQCLRIFLPRLTGDTLKYPLAGTLYQCSTVAVLNAHPTS